MSAKLVFKQSLPVVTLRIGRIFARHEIHANEDIQTKGFFRPPDVSIVNEPILR